jgi:hypothetical protein
VCDIGSYIIVRRPGRDVTIPCRPIKVADLFRNLQSQEFLSWENFEKRTKTADDIVKIDVSINDYIFAVMGPSNNQLTLTTLV